MEIVILTRLGVQTPQVDSAKATDRIEDGNEHGS